MGEALPLWSPRIDWRRKGFQHRVIKEVRERSVANVVQKACNTQRLNNETFTWGRYSVAG